MCSVSVGNINQSQNPKGSDKKTEENCQPDVWPIENMLKKGFSLHIENIYYM